MTKDFNVSVSMNQAAPVKTGVVLKQGDFGFDLKITVLDFTVTGTTPQIVFRKPMGAVESTNVTASGNVYTYTFKGTELDTPGKVFCDLKLKNSTTQRISTASFQFEVVADTLDGLAEEASSYSDTIKQIIQEYELDVSNLEGQIDGAIKQSGELFSKNLVTGYSIIANVGGIVQFTENENRMYYSFKTRLPFKVNLLKNSSSYKVAVIIANSAGICLSNSGWSYRTTLSFDVAQEVTVYVLCDFTTTADVPDAYVESQILDYIKTELSTSAPLWEFGSIIGSNGAENNNDTTSIRTIDKLFYSVNINVFILNPDYRVKLFIYNSDGTYISDMNWVTSSGKILLDTSKRYRFQISTIDSSDINMQEAIQSVKIENVIPNESEFTLSKQNLKAIANGYSKAIPLRWESGSITSSGADKNPDVNVIRTPFPVMHFDGNIKIFMEDTQYRFRFYYYNSDGSAFVGYSSWYTNSGITEYSINPNYTYRIQIATQNASNMNMDDAIMKIIFCYHGDTIEDPIAPYWIEYLKTRSEKINTYLVDGKNKSTFLFLTDTHWNNSPKSLNGQGINQAMFKYISKECNINTLIHGGDLNSEYRSNKNIARKFMTNAVAEMRKGFDNVLMTRGNHDDNIEGAYNNWDYVITQSDSYSYMFRGTEDVTFGETGTYFYKDNEFEKLRIISLDCVDFPYDNSIDPTKSDLKILAYGYEQLQWLCNILRGTPSGYSIVIFTHAMLAPSAVTVDYPSTSPQTRAKDYLYVCDILKAYKNRNHYTETMDGSFVTSHSDYYTGELDGDFTSADAIIVGVFSGHEHIDCIEEILDSNGNGIGIYNTCTQNSSALFSDQIISSAYQHPMEIGTTSELVWDAVIIDRSNKHVDMIRIGASEANTEVSAVDVRSFNYT